MNYDIAYNFYITLLYRNDCVDISNNATNLKDINFLFL